VSATEFRSEDGRFGLTVPERALADLRRFCEAAQAVETGGILVGFYTPSGDSAVVTRVTGPPMDSKAGSTWFQRGTDAVNEQLVGFWGKGEFYLGEWHFHPDGAPPVPSDQDCKQLQEIAASKQYHCPEPILAVASLLTKGDLSLAAFVFPRRRTRMALSELPSR